MRWATVGLAAVLTSSVWVAGADGVLVRLWQDPRPIAARDLRWGPGSADRAPKPPFRFVESVSSGTQPKLVVSDAGGATWDVKFGEEVHAEVAASRVVWALGYYADELYFVPEGTITGAGEDLGPAKDFVDERGAFRAARFERRQEHHAPVNRGWSFPSNPFTGTRELSGLKILMTLLCNWDVDGERNNRVVAVTAPGTEPHRIFFVSDLGATFGRMGRRLSNHSKWQLDDYRQEGFIDKVDEDEVELDFDGLESGMEKVPLEHARWFAELVGELTPAQVRQAFEAAGATPQDVEGFSDVLLARIAQLRTAVGLRATSSAEGRAGLQQR